MSLGPQVVNYGNIQATFLLQVSLTPTAVGATTSAEQTFTVPGLLVGDQISAISFQGAYTVLVDYVNSRVSANNTLAISFANNTGGSLTPPTGTWLLEINRPAFPAPQPSVIQ
jgi:hypothetical protein